MLRRVLVAQAIATLDVSAASGLVALADRLCLVADDEVFLAVYAMDGTPLPRIPLFPDLLPEDHAERKRRKPDLEAVALLPDGRVLALGSGSSPNRRRAAVLDPTRPESVRALDLGPLYDRLATDVPELNIEGAAVNGDALWLLQRGNGAARFNATVALDLRRVITSIRERATIDPDSVRSVTRIGLGDLEGVPLSFTDAFVTPGGRLGFSAAAEDTLDPYLDGRVAGSVVGVLDGPHVAEFLCVDPALKLEGVALATDDPVPALWLVADPDDRELRAALYRAPLPFS